jgi:hypothetical protein
MVTTSARHGPSGTPAKEEKSETCGRTDGIPTIATLFDYLVFILY